MGFTGWQQGCSMIPHRVKSTAAVLALFAVSAVGVAPLGTGVSAADSGSGLSHDRAFLTAAYEDFLGRAPSVDELSSATSVPLDTVAARGRVVSGLSTSSEWIGVTVDKLYQDTLGRPADTSGKAYWVGALSQGRMTVAQAAANFYSSSEYFTGFGHSSVATWVSDLYTKVLARSADQSGLAYWASAAARHGRWWVAYSFYQSSESCHTRVKNLYAALLGRAPDTGGWDYWAGQVKAKGDLVLAAQLASSPEYYSRAWDRYGTSVPGAPTGVTATPGETQATVTWQAPESNGGAAITGYTVTASPGSATCSTTGALTCTVTGLTNGTSYTFTVKATNSVGAGSASLASSAVIAGLPNVTQIVTAGYTTCAVADGKGYCWGDNFSGQVGNGSSGDRDPVPAPYLLPLSNVTQITSTGDTTCAVADGRGYCWGDNSYGRVGNGELAGDVSTPYQLPLSDVTHIATSTYGTSCAVAGGKGYCWGGNGYGEAGSGSTWPTPTPYQVPLSDVTQIASIGYTTCAVAGGKGYCWGNNSDGQVGNGSSGDPVLTPYQLPWSGVTQITAITLGTSCAVADGRGYCWGDNSYGRVGNGSSEGDVLTPYQLPLSDVAQIAGTDDTSCAVAAGKGYCWGYNSYGQVGNGSAGGVVSTPYQLPLSDVTQITSPGTVSCAVAGGKGYCWGYNYYGEVGTGSAGGFVLTPYQLSLSDVTQITSAGAATCAIAGGRGFCLGDNWYGEVGNGSSVGYVLVPYQL